MGLLGNIFSFGQGIVAKAQSIGISGVETISNVAGRIDSLIPHPSNGGLQNVVDVLAAPFVGKRVVANVDNKIIKAGLEFVSNNPFATSAIVTGAVGGTKAVVQSGVSEGYKTVAPAIKASGIINAPPSQAPKGGVISTAPSAPTMNGSPQSANGGIIKASSTPRTSYQRKTRKTPSSPKRKGKKRRQTRRSSSKKKYGTAKQYKRKGGKSVKYTKNGQPYIILASGKARFIKGKRRK